MTCPFTCFARSCGDIPSPTRHWVAQRVSAVLLVLLTPWFIAGLLGQVDQPAAEVAIWLGQVHIAVPLAVFLIVSFWHTAQGLQVVLEDYVPTLAIRRAGIVAVRGACVVLTGVGLAALVRFVWVG